MLTKVKVDVNILFSTDCLLARPLGKGHQLQKSYKTTYFLPQLQFKSSIVDRYIIQY
jgi:hypothetical protein